MPAKSTASLKKRSMAAARKAVSKIAKTPVKPVVIPAAVAVEAPEAPAVIPVAVAGPSDECLTAIGNLGHIDADVARAAANRLGEIGDRVAVDPLISVVDNASGYYHDAVRVAAAASLGQIGDARAVDALARLADAWMAETSVEAVRALANISDARAAVPIRAIVSDATGYYAPIVRHAAEAALPRLLAA